jgi:hypothetical protein
VAKRLARRVALGTYRVRIPERVWVFFQWFSHTTTPTRATCNVARIYRGVDWVRTRQGPGRLLVELRPHTRPPINSDSGLLKAILFDWPNIAIPLRGSRYQYRLSAIIWMRPDLHQILN